VKRPLRELARGDIFRTADGLLWLRASAYPTVRGEMVTCSAVARGAGPRDFRTDTEVEPLDLPALLSRHAGLEKENAELRAVLHDLWQDRTAAAAGAELERGAVRALIGDTLRGVTGVHDAVAGRLLAALESRGPTRPPVPPCALEVAAREAVTLLAPYYESGVDKPFVGEVKALLARLRAALGEG
jgi:hypothetical protein